MFYSIDIRRFISMIVNVRLIHRDQCLIHDSNEYHCIAPLFFTNQRLLETIVLLWYWYVYWVFLLNGSKRYCHSLKFNLSFCSIPTSNIQCMNEVGHAITNFIWLEKSHFKICSGRIKSGNKNVFYRSYTLQYNSLHRFPKKQDKGAVHWFHSHVLIGSVNRGANESSRV